LDSSQSLNEFLIREYESFLERIEVLERRRRLTPLDFGAIPQPKGDAARVDALNALVRWRLERLESMDTINS
jgi:hypothetical protein